MNNMQDRLKILRNDKEMSQVEFGKLIGISRSQIACYENGIRELTERTINDICREFNVNKDWLLTGEGEMYIVSNEDERLAKILVELHTSDNENLKNLIEKMLELDDKYINIILNLVDTVLEDQKNKG